jgi:very-short-patch-repair endonuclease
MGRRPHPNYEQLNAEMHELLAKQGAVALKPYMSAKIRVKCRCKEGHDFDQTLAGLRIGHGCQTCSSRSRIRAKERFFQSLIGRGEALSEYIDTKTLVKLKCHSCGNIWDGEPCYIMRGGWCEICTNGSNAIKSERAQRNLITLIESRGGKFVGPYTGFNSPVLVECGKGHTVNMYPGNIRDGGWCCECAKNGHEGGKQRFLDAVRYRNGKLIGEHVNSSTKVILECELGHRWKVTPNAVLNSGSWCDQCAATGGECDIIGYLRAHNYEYYFQYEVTINGRQHYFDFLVKIGNVWLFIEFDGGQHFEDIPYYYEGTGVTFEDRRERDLEKDVYVLSFGVGYSLLRIPATHQKKIPEILDLTFEELCSHPLCCVKPPNDYYSNYAAFTNEEIVNKVIHRFIPLDTPPVYLTIN